MKTYIIETNSYHISADYTKHYTLQEAQEIVRSGYGRNPWGHDLYRICEINLSKQM